MGLIIYGGSFNPPHIGHMRLAIESLEMLEDKAQRLDFVPCARPPHKKISDLLPFSLRKAMLEACLGDQPRMFCNDLEARREGPSYTLETLREYGQNFAGGGLYFLLGSQDFLSLDSWLDWREFPRFCNLLVVPRGNFTADDFAFQAEKYWPECRNCADYGKMRRIKSPMGGEIIFLPLPYLEISASLIRRAWLSGKSVEYLVPAPALELLNKEKRVALACWREASDNA